MTIDFNSPITILEISIWMDGGSVTLNCVNTSNQKFEIEFHQYMIVEQKSPQYPGRIHLNKQLIKERSKMEFYLLHALEAAQWNPNKKFDKLDHEILREKIDYVRSEQFLINNQRFSEFNKQP